MTAKLRLITGGIADRNTVAGVDHAMQELAHARKTEPRPAVAKPHLQLVTVPPQPPCACGESDCQAGPLHKAYLTLRAAWQANPGQAYTLVALAWGAYRIAADACFARICPHLKREEVRIVIVAGVDLDDGTIGDVRYTARMVGNQLEVVPLPDQGVTNEDTDHYWLAAVHLARLEMHLDEIEAGL